MCIESAGTDDIEEAQPGSALALRSSTSFLLRSLQEELLGGTHDLNEGQPGPQADATQQMRKLPLLNIKPEPMDSEQFLAIDSDCGSSSSTTDLEFHDDMLSSIASGRGFAPARNTQAKSPNNAGMLGPEHVYLSTGEWCHLSKSISNVLVPQRRESSRCKMSLRTQRWLSLMRGVWLF